MKLESLSEGCYGVTIRGEWRGRVVHRADLTPVRWWSIGPTHDAMPPDEAYVMRPGETKESAAATLLSHTIGIEAFRAIAGVRPLGSGKLYTLPGGVSLTWEGVMPGRWKVYSGGTNAFTGTVLEVAEWVRAHLLPHKTFGGEDVPSAVKYWNAEKIGYPGGRPLEVDILDPTAAED